MTTAKQVYEAVKPLPESLIREVLDFVHFLRARRGVTPERAEELNLIYAQETRTYLKIIDMMKLCPYTCFHAAIARRSMGADTRALSRGTPPR